MLILSHLARELVVKHVPRELLLVHERHVWARVHACSSRALVDACIIYLAPHLNFIVSLELIRYYYMKAASQGTYVHLLFHISTSALSHTPKPSSACFRLI
jgi:hypothetical protein